MRKFSLKLFAVVFILMLSCSPICAKTKKNVTRSKAPAQQPGFYSLSGNWNVTRTYGTARNSRQPWDNIDVTIEDVKFTIEEVKFYESSGEGTANIIYNCTIRDSRGNIIAQRTWEYALPYDVKREAPDKWTFSSEYLDGEDKITLTLKTTRTAEIRFEGVNWDDVFPEDRITFDVTCEASKK